MEKKIVVHGRKFFEILKEMDADALDLDIGDNTMTMKQKQAEFVLSLQDPEEFPEVREITGSEEFSLSGAIFLEMLEKVGFAISSDETRYVLTGMYIVGTEGLISVVGTDGFRMALYQQEVEGVKGFPGIIIPKRSILEIGRMIEEGDEMRFVVGEKHVQFSTPSVTVISRLLEGSFPDYENVVPRNNTERPHGRQDEVYEGPAESGDDHQQVGADKGDVVGRQHGDRDGVGDRPRKGSPRRRL